MGTTKRVGKKKAAKKKPTKKATKKATKKKAPAKTVRSLPDRTGMNILLVDDVQALAEQMNEKLNVLSVESVAPVTDGVFEQETMQAYLSLEAVGSRVSAPLGAILANLRSAALSHRAGDGGFEQGKVVATFPSSGGVRSPKWKGEAESQAKQLRALQFALAQVLSPEDRERVEGIAANFMFDAKAYGEAVKAVTKPSDITTNVKFVEGA